ncbi:hypothetical protein Tco_0855837 [Tanacetum coccineum]
MTTLQFADTHNLVAFLAKPVESEGFEQIVDFLNANPIRYALTINPTIYTSCIKQFWATAKVKTVNGEIQLQALVDGKKIIVTEASVRRDLQLNDEEGRSSRIRRILKDGGGDFRYSDTVRLSRSDKVLKLKNFKKDATLKLSKSTNQERYEHVGLKVVSSQDGKVSRWQSFKMAKRLCLVDDLKMLKITMSNSSSRNKLYPEINDHYNIFTGECQKDELKTQDKALYARLKDL